MTKKFTDEQLRNKLTPLQYHVLCQKGTEEPFSGEYLDNHGDGTYTCKICGAELFSSKDKFDSKAPGLAGWPSFANVMSKQAVKLTEDFSEGMHRVEVSCANCGGHLGHVFSGANDAPKGGVHFCINSAGLDFLPKNLKNKK